LAGRAAVVIEDNVGRASFSISLDRLILMKGRYLNGSCRVEASPEGEPSKLRISQIKINERAISGEWIDRPILGWRSVRSRLADWLSERDIATVRIENNRIIATTRGQ